MSVKSDRAAGRAVPHITSAAPRAGELRMAAAGIRPVTTGASGASLLGRDRPTTSVTPADRQAFSHQRFAAHTVAMPSSEPGQAKVICPALSDIKLQALQARHALTEADALALGEDAECNVCLRSMVPSAEELVVRLPCEGGHIYHLRCLLPWFEKASICPTCRGTLKVRLRPGDSAASKKSRCNRRAPSSERRRPGSPDSVASSAASSSASEPPQRAPMLRSRAQRDYDLESAAIAQQMAARRAARRNQAVRSTDGDVFSYVPA
jgi:hypothetical protein